MPFFLHQWIYKDQHVLSMIKDPQNRGDVVRLATEVFHGKLHQFFFCLGDYDGVAISEFKDNVTALACLMTVLGQGNVQTIKTTPLLTFEESGAAMEMAKKEIE